VRAVAKQEDDHVDVVDAEVVVVVAEVLPEVHHRHRSVSPPRSGAAAPFKCTNCTR
jgi:hypothetical protein